MNRYLSCRHLPHWTIPTAYIRCFNESNPTVEQLFDLFCQTRDCIPAFVIAVGGGSIMDVGKALCCLYGKEIVDTAALRRIISNKEYGIPAARWIGVPTTAGTGSETTCWATIWDPTKDCKRSIESRDNYAWAALVDPDLATGMPIGLAVSSALDAMAHAVESYWARATNCVSRALALQAVRTIMGAMDDLLDGKAQAHDAMAQGSMLAGLAFSNTKTTACHSISYPLTIHYHIPHGAAVSLLLAPMLAVNAAKITDLPALLDACICAAQTNSKTASAAIWRVPVCRSRWKLGVCAGKTCTIWLHSA
ncbi:MAG: phosphonoacetaldehyde reductase [Butyricicoccus pullicaecorum]